MIGELVGLYAKYEDLIVFIATGPKNRDEIFEFGFARTGRSTAYDYVRQTFKKNLPMVSVENGLAMIDPEKVQEFIELLSEALNIDLYELFREE